MSNANKDGSPGAAVMDIGSRLELFVDHYLIDRLQGAELKLHSPTSREVALQFDKPWEGTSSTYVSMCKDAGRYLVYYRGSEFRDRIALHTHTCCAVSEDGIHWVRPSLGICEFGGSADNNIIWRDPEGERETCGVVSHNFMAFLDGNPNVPEAERYKALASGPIVGLASADGFHWKRVQAEPILFPYAKCNRKGDYISLAFWDAVQRRYVAYVRGWRRLKSTQTQCEEDPDKPHTGYRQVMYATSPDFVHWSEPRFIDLGETPLEHFYTSAATPYFRAPHIYVAFPKRFLPERKRVPEHPSPGVSDAVFLSSRDGVHWNRTFMEAFVRPGRDRENWTQRSMMMAQGVLPTATDEISVYWIEHYCHPTCRLRRGTLRTDGFVSVNAGYAGGELITKPLRFEGDELIINYATSAAGSVRVEVQDEDGRPLPGHTLAESAELYGDEIEQVVSWEKGSDVSHAVGAAIRLRFAMKDADLYSIRFRRDRTMGGF